MKPIAIVLLAVVACACAAPRFRNHYHHNPYYDNAFDMGPYMDREIFDTGKFWNDMRSELMGLEKMLTELKKSFIPIMTNEGIVGDKYVIRISLNGYEEKDIVVKAKKGLLIIQAVQECNGFSNKNYLDIRTLPTIVAINGTWTYENGELKIVFPLENTVQEGTTEVTVTEAPVTQSPENSPDVSGNNLGGENVSSEIGNDRGDQGREVDILTNEISNDHQSVEVTTYAVDLKDEVELVPIRREY